MKIIKGILCVILLLLSVYFFGKGFETLNPQITKFWFGLSALSIFSSFILLIIDLENII